MNQKTESILIKNCDLILPTGTFKGDIFTQNGKIIEIGPSINRSAEQVINETGLTLIPGIIDAHVHFREPGATHKETIATGSKAAAAGGVTSFFEMPNTKPSTTTKETLEEKKEIASKTSLVNYNFFIGATPNNLDILNSVKNVPGIKIYVGSSTGSLLVHETEPLEAIFANGNRIISVHSEEEDIILKNTEKYANANSVHAHYKIRSPEAAITCTQKLIKLAQKHQRRLHICHLTTLEEANYLNALNCGLHSLITTEVCPQHLFLSAPEIYDKIGTYAQINPPIREKHHQDALWAALLKGTISMIATDHAPHTIEEKEQPFPKAPSGMPGVQTALPLMLNGLKQKEYTLEQLVKWMSTNPASIYNIKNKGSLIKGYDADWVLIDLSSKQKISNKDMVSKAKWTPFDGWETTGKVIATFVNGQQVFREGDFYENTKGKEIIIGK